MSLLSYVAGMNIKNLRKLCMSFPGATEQIQWEKDRVFKIGGKMFACSGIEKDSLYSFKAGERFLELTDLPGIIPAPYLARAKWVQIDPSICRLSDSELGDLVRASYQQVLEKLPKKTQAAIESLPG